MLSKLSIKNVALIQQADIIFSDGLNVLSGETGAGKSVILDSVNFVLGAKADRSMIRYGESECMVKAEFLLPENAKAVQLLREMDIDSDGEIVISRKFSETGKNSVKINGNTVTATMLRKITDYLVDVHGQSEHFFLLNETNQLKLLDDVVGEPILQEKKVLADYLKKQKSIDEQLQLLGCNIQERNRRLDLLSFQIDEIQSVNLKEGEEEELLAKRNKIINLEKIITALQNVSDILAGEAGVLDRFRSATKNFANIAKLDSSYQNIYDKLESLAFETDDVNEQISDLASELYFDENEAEEVELRLDLIKALKRKYGTTKAEIDSYFQKIQEEYELLSNCESQFILLMDEKKKLLRKIFTVCQNITRLRKTEGSAFCKRVTEELKTLNINHAQFEINFGEYSEEDAKNASVNGLDDIRFMFSANVGEPMKPLGKIISGGEMSRFMLAVKTQLSGLNEICTYVFDEIDAGISGKTAKVVGEKLAKIAKQTQIIAVSHLAQIAVMSDTQFLIEKQEKADKTITNVHSLDDQGKTREIVRLLGGDLSEEFALKHAEELLSQANHYKKTI